MSLNVIQALVQEEFEAVDDLILHALQSKANLVNDIGRHIVQSGGKRLRPLVLLLVSKAFEYGGKQDITLATGLEFIHTATLLHDDVVDHAELRRGKQTANRVWGNEAAILVGDFLYSRAMQMLIACENPLLMKTVADAVNMMSEGEILQLLAHHNLELSEGAYLNIIQSKTAKLFEAAATLAAILAKQSAEIQSSIAHYGMHVGIAFQLMDDVLDYQGLATTSGKKPGNDLLEGKLTLPLIHAIQQGSSKEVREIKQILVERDPESFVAIRGLLEKTGSMAYTVAFAKNESRRAIEALKKLPQSVYREALEALAQFAVDRTH